MFRGGFGPTGVEESLRGLGIGKVLFLRCLRNMKGRGYHRCEIGWVGPISFYAHTADARISAHVYAGKQGAVGSNYTIGSYKKKVQSKKINCRDEGSPPLFASAGRET